MKTINLIVLALLCLLLNACGTDDEIEPMVCQPNPTDPKVAALTDSLNMILENGFIPGLAVTVVKDGAIAYQKTFGQSNIEFDIQYTNQTIQPIASISKTFIAAAILKGIELNYFTLETPINEILPFEIINPHTPNLPITIKQLVTHTAGLQDTEESYSLQYLIMPGEDLNTPAAQVMIALGLSQSSTLSLAEYLPSVYTPTGTLYNANNFLVEGPGNVYAYSNIGASLAAYLIELKSGQPYGNFVKQYILDPLGMENSTYQRNNVTLANKATLYAAKDYPIPNYNHSSYPDGFLNTSNEEMGFYLLEMMKGAAGNGTILNNESYQTLFEQQSPTDIEGDIHSVFWDLVDGRIEHTGGDPGVNTYLSFDPVNNTGIFMMTNINPDALEAPLDIDGDIIIDQLLETFDLVKTFEETE